MVCVMPCCQSKCIACSCRYFSHAAVPSWCGMFVYRLMTIMIVYGLLRDVAVVLDFVEELC